ncbi:MAG: diguanylate cyclase [Treponema sp.]|jgi:diguanylate cyclase (GGDEF)-like protein|nr:diguanylate cyclase [Treponema sp.]
MKTSPKFTILIVDDEKVNLAVLNRILSDEYRIFIAKSGETALQLIASEKPDMILLDVILPDINGFDIIVKLKEKPDTKNIPVICITGSDSEADEEKGFRLGAVDYIMKPFSSSIVKARVRTHMEIVRQMRAVERLGLTDPLTNISNRRSFDDRLNMEWRRAIREKKPISCLMIDIDNFKNYNDTYGHQQGDILLKKIAKIFSSRARRPADLPARLGGEEFGMLFPDTDGEAAVSIAEGIRSDVEALRVPIAGGEGVSAATISIGVVSAAPGRNAPVKDFISLAGEYLYAAKRAGKNRVRSGSMTASL